MRPYQFLAIVASAAACAQAGPGGASSGRLVVFGDEWVVSDTAFDQDRQATTQFALNVAEYFTPGATGRFLIFSDNAFAFGVEFPTTLTSAGYTVDVNPPGLSFTAEGLDPYDGVFLAGVNGSGAANASVLSGYIDRGGSVMVLAGTGSPFDGAPGEAAAWNHLLNIYNLSFGPTYYGLPSGNDLIDLPLLPTVSLLGRNLDSLRWGYGQQVSITDPSDPAVRLELTGDFTGFTQPPPGSVMGIAGSYNIPSCSLADLADPFGLLDLADVTAFAQGFVGTVPFADLNGDGLFDLSDVNLFVASFLAGCP
jgi:hypothetical protein